MAKVEKPGSRGLGEPIRRDHSPYCESKGPIIQEGFVSQRIRALQALQAHAMAGNRSHSPMVPCPPRWVKSYEPISPPRLPHRPAIEVPAMTEYRAIKHRWDRIARERQEAVAEQTSSSAPLRFQPRDSQPPSRIVGPGNLDSVKIKAVPRIGQGSNASPNFGQAEGYQGYFGHAYTTQSKEQTLGRLARIRETRPEELDSVPRKSFSSSNLRSTNCQDMVHRRPVRLGVTEQEESDGVPRKSFSSSNLRSTNSQDMVRSQLHLGSVDPTRGMRAMGSDKRQELDTGALQHAFIENNQSIASTAASPTSDRQQQTTKSPTATKSSLLDHVLLPHERAGSGTAEPDEHGPIISTFQDFDFGSHLPISIHSSVSSKHEILGPNPVPAGLADASAISRSMSPRKIHNNGFHKEHDQELKSQPQRKSVADQLGVLVERGWDEPSRATSQDIDSESVSNQTHGDETRSRCLSSDQPASCSDTPSRGTHPSEASPDMPNEHGTAHIDHPSLKSTPKTLSDFAIPQPKDLQMGGLNHSPKKFSLERTISDVSPGIMATSLSSPTSKRRIAAQQQLHYCRRNESRESIELKDLSLGSPPTGEQVPLLRRADIQEKEGSAANPNNALHEPEQEGVPLTGSSPTPSPHDSIISANRFTQPSSRSTSWLRKGWLKAVLGDRKQSTEGDRLRNTSTGASDLNCQDDTQQDHLSRSKQPSEDAGTAQSLIEGGMTGEPTNTTTFTGLPQRHERPARGTKSETTKRQNLSLTRQDYDNASGNWNLESPPLESPKRVIDKELLSGLPEQNSRKRARNSSGYYSRSTSSISSSLLSKKYSKKAAKTSSGTASHTSQPSENSLHSSQSRPFPTSAPRPKLSRTSSTSVMVRVYKTDKIPTPPLNHARQSRRSASKAEQVQQRSTEEEAVQSTVGRQNGLKKVQIIISFDGAEDLVVEATSAGAIVEESWRL